MGHIPDDKNYDEFMGASSEEWSKPEEPAPIPDSTPDQTNRWGAVQPDLSTADSPSRWGSEASSEPTFSEFEKPVKQGKSKWWIILIVIVVALCLCTCLIVFGLPLLGLNLLNFDILQ
jgi:hypothetical protein